MNNLSQTRPVWVEINLDNLAHNIREVRKKVEGSTIIMAVVKANGYGHGSIDVAKTFLSNGANRLGVAILSEGIELRKGNIDSPILILGYTPPQQYDKVLGYNLIQTIYSYDDAEKLSSKAVEMDKEAIIHIKIDSGMGRIGFLPNEQTIDDIQRISKLPNIKIEGIFTHFAKADETDKSYSRTQFQRFTNVVDSLKEKKINIPIKHVSNSAAIIDLPEYNLDIVRPGIILYGYYPSREMDRDKIDLKPAMTLKARVSYIKTVPKGEGISYGQIFTTEKESVIATLPIGYGDGYSRMLTNKGNVFINGMRVPIVGKICMDQLMIDVTNVNNVKIGDEAVLFGYGVDGCIHVDEIADYLGTINYEIVCMVGRRVPRVYISSEKISHIINYLGE